MFTYGVVGGPPTRHLRTFVFFHVRIYLPWYPYNSTFIYVVAPTDRRVKSLKAQWQNGKRGEIILTLAMTTAWLGAWECDDGTCTNLYPLGCLATKFPKISPSGSFVASV